MTALPDESAIAAGGWTISDGAAPLLDEAARVDRLDHAGLQLPFAYAREVDWQRIYAWRFYQPADRAIL